MKKMTLEDIQELIKFVAKSGATEVDLEFEGIKISIKSPPKKRRGEKEEVVTVIQPPATVVAAETAPSADLTATKSEPQKQKETKTEDDSKYITINTSYKTQWINYISENNFSPPINAEHKLKVLKNDIEFEFNDLSFFNQLISTQSNSNSTNPADTSSIDKLKSVSAPP